MYHCSILKFSTLVRRDIECNSVYPRGIQRFFWFGFFCFVLFPVKTFHHTALQQINSFSQEKQQLCSPETSNGEELVYLKHNFCKDVKTVLLISLLWFTNI